MEKILVVDDEKEFCNLLQRFLTKVGYEVDIALDGEAALENIKVDPPSLVLLDMKMPGMGGLEVLERIREKGTKPPVIMITASSEEELRQKALSMGANGYFIKPIDFKLLEDIVTASLNLF